MSRYLLSTLMSALVITVSVPSSGSTAAQKGEVIIGRIDSTLLPLLKTSLVVLDPGRRSVKNLDGKGVRLWLDGTELSWKTEIPKGADSYFELEAADPESAPVSIALTVDVSGSMKGIPLQEAKHAAEKIVSKLSPADTAALITFGAKAERKLQLTSNRDEIMTLLHPLLAAEKETVLYDALCNAIDLLSTGPTGRKAVVVFSDGKDEGSRLKPEDCIQKATENHIPVFSLIFGPPQTRDDARKGLGRVSRLSGGIDFYHDASRPGQDPSPAILEELKAQYLLSLSDARLMPDGREHTLTIVVLPVAGMTGEARTSLSFRTPLVKDGLPLTSVIFILVLFILAGGAATWLWIGRHRQPLPWSSPASVATDVPGKEKSYDAIAPTRSTVSIPGKPVLERDKTDLFPAAPLALSWLIEKEGKNPGRVHRIAVESLTIGRSAHADIPLFDETVSEKHAKVRKEEGGLVIYDLASTNGVFINQERIQSRVLRDGDEVKLGNTILVFKEVHGPEKKPNE